MSLPLNPPPLQVPSSFLGNTPEGKQQAAFFSGLLTTIYQLWNAVYGIRTNAKVKTTDATNTALIRVKIDSGKTMMVEARVVARRDNGDSAWYTLTGAYKNIGGVLSGIGTPDLIGGEDQAAWNVGFTSAGTEAIVQVLGAAGHNVTWEGTISTYEVGA